MTVNPTNKKNPFVCLNLKTLIKNHGQLSGIIFILFSAALVLLGIGLILGGSIINTLPLMIAFGGVALILGSVLLTISAVTYKKWVRPQRSLPSNIDSTFEIDRSFLFSSPLETAKDPTLSLDIPRIEIFLKQTIPNYAIAHPEFEWKIVYDEFAWKFAGLSEEVCYRKYPHQRIVPHLEILFTSLTEVENRFRKLTEDQIKRNEVTLKYLTALIKTYHDKSTSEEVKLKIMEGVTHSAYHCNAAHLQDAGTLYTDLCTDLSDVRLSLIRHLHQIKIQAVQVSLWKNSCVKDALHSANSFRSSEYGKKWGLDSFSSDIDVGIDTASTASGWSLSSEMAAKVNKDLFALDSLLVLIPSLTKSINTELAENYSAKYYECLVRSIDPKDLTKGQDAASFVHENYYNEDGTCLNDLAVLQLLKTANAIREREQNDLYPYPE